MGRPAAWHYRRGGGGAVEGEDMSPNFDENWTEFYEAAEKLRELLSLSRGGAWKVLRELCADGTVRSMRVEVDEDGYATEAPELIKPSKWHQREIDLEWQGEFKEVHICEDDLNHWLAKQQPEQQPEKPAPTSRKRSLVEQAIKE